MVVEPLIAQRFRKFDSGGVGPGRNLPIANWVAHIAPGSPNMTLLIRPHTTSPDIDLLANAHAILARADRQLNANRPIGLAVDQPSRTRSHAHHHWKERDHQMLAASFCAPTPELSTVGVARRRAGGAELLGCHPRYAAQGFDILPAVFRRVPAGLERHNPDPRGVPPSFARSGRRLWKMSLSRVPSSR